MSVVQLCILYTLPQPSESGLGNIYMKHRLKVMHRYNMKRLFPTNVQNVLLNYPVDSQRKYAFMLYFLGVRITSEVFWVLVSSCVLLTTIRERETLCMSPRFSRFLAKFLKYEYFLLGIAVDFPSFWTFSYFKSIIYRSFICMCWIKI